jgi:hypothetical protein
MVHVRRVDPMENHRTSQRRRALKEGKVILSDRIVIDCRIRDISESGARLEFGAFFELPREFRLFIPSSNMLVPAELAWQRGQAAGVHFTGPGQDAPHNI